MSPGPGATSYRPLPCQRGPERPASSVLCHRAPCDVHIRVLSSRAVLARRGPFAPDSLRHVATARSGLAREDGGLVDESETWAMLHLEINSVLHRQRKATVYVIDLPGRTWTSANLRSLGRSR